MMEKAPKQILRMEKFLTTKFLWPWHWIGSYGIPLSAHWLLLNYCTNFPLIDRCAYIVTYMWTKTGFIELTQSRSLANKWRQQMYHYRYSCQLGWISNSNTPCSISVNVSYGIDKNTKQLTEFKPEWLIF